MSAVLRHSLAAFAASVLLCTAGAAVAADAPLTVNGMDTSAFPEVRLTVSLPPSLADGSDVTFEVLENERRIAEVTAQPAADDAQPAQVVLVMDTSGSMKGAPLDNAKAAANALVDALDPEATVALVTFSDRVRVVSGLTDDRAALKAAISGMNASGETALYDGIVQAAALVPRAAEARPSVIVLSDGADTASRATFDRAIERASDSGAPVYAVALKSGEYNPRALELVAGKTGGRLVPVARAEALAKEFETIAKEINSVWGVTYRSANPRTKDLEIDITAREGESVASASFALPNPGIGDLGTEQFVPAEVTDNPAMLIGAVVAGFVAVAMLVAGILLLVLKDHTGLEQLRFYDQLQSDAADDTGASDAVRAAIVGAVGTVAGKRGLTQLVAQRLEAAGWPLRPAEYMTGHIALVVVSGVATELLTGRVSAALVVVLVATVAPMLAIGVAAERRHARFEEQLPDVLAMIAGSLRGGWGIQQAIALACQEAPEPSASELKRVDTETRLGIPLERALMSMADRMDSDDFRAAVNAIAVQRDVGGNLAEILDIVGKTIRERDAMRRHIKALTAEGRLSAWILIGLPFAVLAIMIVFNPTYIEPMFSTPVGLLTMMVGCALLGIGGLWLYRITRIEV